MRGPPRRGAVGLEPAGRRRFLRLAPGLLVAALLALAGWTWWRSEAHLRSFTPPPAFSAAIPTDAASLRRGEHIARTRGCFSCHGDKLQGDVFVDQGWRWRAVAPNLTELARRLSPAMLERAIRHGIGHDGRALYAMPSYNFARLSDADTAALIAFLRQAPVATADLPRATLGPLIRWDLATGRDAAIPAFVPKVPPLAWQAHPDPAVRRGEYLAMTACNECHGFGLRGDDPFAPPGEGPPDLVVVGGYAKPDFVRLMRTGKAIGDRELRLMSDTARGRYAHFSDAEVDDLYAFLSAMSAKAAAGP